MILGSEFAPTTGQQHLQGYIRFDNARHFNSIQALFPNVHIEPAKGNPQQNFEYCSKENDYKEWGIRPEMGKHIEGMLYNLSEAYHSILDQIKALQKKRINKEELHSLTLDLEMQIIETSSSLLDFDSEWNSDDPNGWKEFTSDDSVFDETTEALKVLKRNRDEFRADIQFSDSPSKKIKMLHPIAQHPDINGYRKLDTDTEEEETECMMLTSCPQHLKKQKPPVEIIDIETQDMS